MTFALREAIIYVAITNAAYQMDLNVVQDAR